jgi:BirA family biotin operon repressor/biotin-[acetyl-CoA-carboxylase] ligase
MIVTPSPSTAPPSAGAAPAGDWRIDRVRALARASHAVPDEALEIVDETASTNTDLMQRMKALSRAGAEPGVQALRVAYRQTAGRGRQGRSWHAGEGNALTFSLGCVLPRPLAQLAGLSLAVGTAIVEGLRTLPLDDASRIVLKWPNDVLLDASRGDAPRSALATEPLPLSGGKLAGVLIETAWSTPAESAAVIGIGINVRHDEALAAELEAAALNVPAQARATPPAALSQAWRDANLTDTLAAVLGALVGMLERFSADGFAPFRERWSAYHAYADRDVVLLEKGVELARGTALGVDETGQLLLATTSGLRTVATGDVSLRLAQSAP